MHEIPHRSIIDPKAARGEFDHQSAHSEGTVSDSPRPNDRVLAGDPLGLVPVYLTWSDAARKSPGPNDHRAGATPKSRRRLMPFPSVLASFPSRTVNQNSADSGISLDSARIHPFWWLIK
jgi:hypothetical protein